MLIQTKMLNNNASFSKKAAVQILIPAEIPRLEAEYIIFRKFTRILNRMCAAVRRNEIYLALYPDIIALEKNMRE